MTGAEHRPLRAAWVGTFEPTFSRNQRLGRLLELAGVEVVTLRFDLWDQDRLGLARSGKLKVALRALLVYPRLLWRLWRQPPPDIYLVSYPGWFDVPFVAMIARLKKRPLVFDPFFLLHETAIEDRQMFETGSLVERVAGFIDRLSLRLADVVIADTEAHLRFYQQVKGGSSLNGGVLAVGADDAVFRPVASEVSDKLVLFYGTFVPLQGIGTIIEAARLVQSDGIRFTIIGDGQERPLIENQLAEHAVTNVELLDPVPLADLPAYISRAGVCLGIFGASDKADRVIPHKVYECLAMGRPVITRSGSAIADAFSEDEVVSVPPADAAALAHAITSMARSPIRREAIAVAGALAYQTRFHEDVLSASLVGILTEWTKGES